MADYLADNHAELYREAEYQRTRLMMMLGACVARLGGRVVLEQGDFEHKLDISDNGNVLTTTPMPFPLVQGKDLGKGMSDWSDIEVKPGRWSKGTPVDHDEPIACDYPPVVPGEFPMSH